MYIIDSNQYAIELVTYLLVLVVYFYELMVYILLERNAFNSIAFFSQCIQKIPTDVTSIPMSKAYHFFNFAIITSHQN